MKTLKKIIEKNGIAQLDMVIEECAELIQAVNKVKRANASYVDGMLLCDSAEAISNLAEETADVLIMVEQLKIFLGDEQIKFRVKEKLDKLEGGA